MYCASVKKKEIDGYLVFLFLFFKATLPMICTNGEHGESGAKMAK
jgi:hypothetical protein